NVKNLQVKGSIKVATNALGNKTAKTSTFTTAVNNILSADQATILAQLLQLQIRQQSANDLITTYYNYQTASAKTLLGGGGKVSVGSGIYGGLTGVNNNNSVATAYYNNLYDNSITDTTGTTDTTSTTGSTSSTST
ncbi:MAG: hypothetical protein PHE78_02710, partial [Candidatus Gastranaerophilales bacterium]|nr:hypothetical protein [Candidatus Gastranaerophilales bacterium]